MYALIPTTPRKRFGQHFLTDSAVLESILAAISPERDDRVIEIGPGTGVLTARLLERLDHLVAVELDRDLAKYLDSRFSGQPLSIIQEDILSTDLRSLPVPGNGGKLRIVGNLPYNISTPLLFHLLDSLDIIEDMLFMVQKEVALRLVANAGERNYGRLSVMASLKLDCDYLFEVAPQAFSPPPKVNSAVVHMRPRKPTIEPEDPARLEMLVRNAFAQRRKTLRNALSGMITREQFEDAGIDGAARAETLSPLEFLRLSEIGQSP